MGGRGDFADFVNADATRLLRIAYLLTGDREAAEDLLQDTLERVYVAWPRVENPFAYARTALVRRSANRWRDRIRRPEAPLDAAGDVPHDDGADGSERIAHRDQLTRALARLGPRQRAAVVLRYLEDLSEVETAAALGCSVGTVKSQTSRALARLRAVIDEPSAERGAAEGRPPGGPPSHPPPRTLHSPAEPSPTTRRRPA
jgi:RNA polymerase sigma-70 factor (sigma-E family)